MRGRPRCSIIIATFNRHDILGATLASVLKQDYEQYELIVIDQSTLSYAGVHRFAADSAVPFQYLHRPVPNLPKARNTGIEMAEGDIVIFIDDDVLLDANYIAHHARHYLDPTVGGVTGLVLSLDAANADPIAQAKTHRCLRRPTLDQPVDVRWLSGCSMSYRKTALLDVGGFDIAYTGSSWCEDVDVSVRVSQRGLRLLFDPHIRLVHLAAPRGGCQNRAVTKASNTAREHADLTLYFVVKNSSRIGIAWKLHTLWNIYRQYALNRQVAKLGFRELARRSLYLAKTAARLVRRYALVDSSARL